MISLHLPWPISANSRMGIYRGRAILSKAARTWYAKAEASVAKQRWKPVKGPVEIEIQLCAPNKRKYDPDNKIKVILDVLVRAGIIEDDNCTIIRKLTVLVDDMACEIGTLVFIEEYKA